MGPDGIVSQLWRYPVTSMRGVVRAGEAVWVAESG